MPSGDHFSPLQWRELIMWVTLQGLLCSACEVALEWQLDICSGAVPAADFLQVGGLLNYNGVAVYAFILRIQSKLFNIKNPYLYSSCWLSLSLVAAGTIYQKSWKIHAKEHNKVTRPEMRHSALHSSTDGYPNTTCWFPTSGMQRLNLTFLKANSAFLTD